EQPAGRPEPSALVVEEQVVLEVARADEARAELRHRGPRGLRPGRAELDLALDLASQASLPRVRATPPRGRSSPPAPSGCRARRGARSRSCPPPPCHAPRGRRPCTAGRGRPSPSPR